MLRVIIPSPPMPPLPSSLDALLRRSWLTIVAKWRVILLIVAALSFLGLLMQTVLFQRMGTEMNDAVKRLLGQERYAQVASELQSATSTQKVQEVSRAVATEMAQKIQAMPPSQQKVFFSATLGAAASHLAVPVAVFLPLLILLACWLRAFFYVVALLPQADLRLAVGKATQVFLPLVVVMLVGAIASGIWLPFFLLLLTPFVPALFFLALLSLAVPLVVGPRLVLAPVIYLREGGVFGSVPESFRRSRGAYGKIVGNVLATVVITAVVLWVLLGFIDALMPALLATPFLFFLWWLRQGVSMLVTGYRVVFLAHLSAGVMAGGKKK